MATGSAEIWSGSFGFCPIETASEIFQCPHGRCKEFHRNASQRVGNDCPPSLRCRPKTLSRSKNGGKGIRTPDIQLAKLALYQLSYAPGDGAPNLQCRIANATEKPNGMSCRAFAPRHSVWEASYPRKVTAGNGGC